jgi:hypothetical protein
MGARMNKNIQPDRDRIGYCLRINYDTKLPLLCFTIHNRISDGVASGLLSPIPANLIWLFSLIGYFAMSVE